MLLADFLRSLFEDGRMLLGPSPPVSADDQASRILEAAYRTAALDLAGPTLVFDLPIALSAARLAYHAAWFLLNRDRPENELAQYLVLPEPPTRPEHHFSGDLVLRYVPAVYRRARALAADDGLTHFLEQLLRAWPLSGVLAGIEEGPSSPLDFGGHPGLLGLYAERLALHPKTAWFPSGRALEYVELVWHELGKDPALLPTA